MLISILKALQDRKAPSWVPWRWKDIGVDLLFYDAAAVKLDEWVAAYFSGEPMREGCIVIVHPEKDHQPLKAYDVRDYLEIDPNIKTIAVPGCGSSRVGAIAMGRTVANALGEPVASVIAGYGARDARIDAMLGIYGGTINIWLRFLDPALHKIIPSLPTHIVSDLAETTYDIAYVTPEAATVHALLLHRPGHFKTIVGHSKGNLAIESALNALKFSLRDVDDDDVLKAFGLSARSDTEDHEHGFDGVAEHDKLDILTFGCIVSLPHVYGKKKTPLQDYTYTYPTHQYVGNCDILGGLNTSPQDMWDLYTNNKSIREPEIVDKAIYDGRGLYGHNLAITSPAWHPGHRTHMPIDEILRTYAASKFPAKNVDQTEGPRSSLVKHVPQKSSLAVAHA